MIHLISRKPHDTANWAYWLFPSPVCLFAAILFLVNLVWDKLHDAQIIGGIPGGGLDELREYHVALFLSLYLLSFAVRLKRMGSVVPGSTPVSIPASQSTA